MPLIEICALPPPGGIDVSNVLRVLTLAVSDALSCPPHAVWTTWRSIDGYAVGDVVAREQPQETHAPVVHLYANRPPEAIDAVCDVIEEVLSRELSLPRENIFVTFQPVFAAPA